MENDTSRVVAPSALRSASIYEGVEGQRGSVRFVADAEIIALMASAFGEKIVDQYRHLAEAASDQKGGKRFREECVIRAKGVKGFNSGPMNRRGLDLPIRITSLSGKKAATVMIVGQDPSRRKVDFGRPMADRKWESHIAFGLPYAFQDEASCRSDTLGYWEIVSGLLNVGCENIYLTDALKTFWRVPSPEGKDRKRPLQFGSRDRALLADAIATVKPTVIVTFGTLAAGECLRAMEIQRESRSSRLSRSAPIVLPLLHPAILFRVTEPSKVGKEYATAIARAC